MAADSLSGWHCPRVLRRICGILAQKMGSLGSDARSAGAAYRLSHRQSGLGLLFLGEIEPGTGGGLRGEQVTPGFAPSHVPRFCCYRVFGCAHPIWRISEQYHRPPEPRRFLAGAGRLGGRACREILSNVKHRVALCCYAGHIRKHTPGTELRIKSKLGRSPGVGKQCGQTKSR